MAHVVLHRDHYCQFVWDVYTKMGGTVRVVQYKQYMGRLGKCASTPHTECPSTHPTHVPSKNGNVAAIRVVQITYIERNNTRMSHGVLVMRHPLLMINTSHASNNGIENTCVLGCRCMCCVQCVCVCCVSVCVLMRGHHVGKYTCAHMCMHIDVRISHESTHAEMHTYIHKHPHPPAC